jgi:Ni/Co efflux regulator RcnB
VGYYLPDDIWWEPLPYDLYYRLPPAPYGCRYVMVDRDILIVAIASGIVLDALMYY